MKSITLVPPQRINNRKEWDNYRDKERYLNYLQETIEQVPSGGILKISEDIYLPHEHTLSLPPKITLMPDGGVIRGEGKLVGSHTRISRPFIPLFDPLLPIDLQRGGWEVTESSPEWFGYSGEDAQDDSIRLQKAIDFIDTYSDTNDLLRGGTVVCRPGSDYIIQNTLLLPLGISFDGGNSNFIFDIDQCTIDSLPTDLFFMFAINTVHHIPMRSQGDYIKNIKLTNLKRKERAGGIYCRSQGCEFSFIYSSHMHQTFRRAGDYLDNISLRNFVVGWPETDHANQVNHYAIDMGYIGDNLLVENIATYREVGKNENLLKINTCGGGVIQRLTNGNVLISNSTGIVLDAFHQEYGNITIENSQIHIRGLFHFKKPQVPALVVKNPKGSYNQRFVTISNSIISYDHNLFNYHTGKEEMDIEIQNVATLKIEQVFRKAKYPYMESSSLYGIRVNSAAFMRFCASHSIQSTLIGNQNESYILNDYITYSLPLKGSILQEIALNVGDDIYKENRFPQGEYRYHAALLFDKERNVGQRFLQNEKEKYLSIKVEEDNVRAIRLTFSQVLYAGVCIRLYRQRVGDNTTYYIDLPVCTSFNLFYDFGTYTLFGEPWQEERETSPIQSCSQYQYLGHNVLVQLSEQRRSGKWQAGDIINISSQR